MPARDEFDDRSLEELENEIRRELDRLELEIATALDGRADPGDGSLEELEQLTTRIEIALHDLGRTLARLHAATPTDLNRLAARALEEVLVDIEKPLVLSVHWAEDLPSPTVSAEPLRSLIARILSLVGRFASPGDLVEVGTLVGSDGDIVLRIRLESSGPQGSNEPARELGLRESTLREFVSDLGGRFLIDPAAGGDGVAVEVRLPVGARRR